MSINSFTNIYYEHREKFTDHFPTCPSSLSKWQRAVNEGAAKSIIMANFELANVNCGTGIFIL